MADREMVIKGMECCLPPHDPDCNLCPYDSIDLRCRAKLRDDIMMLLKAQEPKFMTLEEVIAHYSLSPVFVDDFGAQEDYYEDIQPLYFEFPHQEEDSWIVHWRGYAHVARYLGEWKHSYNKKWRCWTAKPTDEQRKAVKWDD